LNLSPYQIALIAGGFSIIGVLLGAWIGYRNALKLHGIVEFNKAATAFRNAFLCELIFLKYDAHLPECERTYTNPQELLRAGYSFRHLKAFNIFRDYLSNKEKVAIDKAWKEYCKFEKYPSKDNEADLKKVALKNIEKILQFAKYK
jgi:hypothetical protein